MTEEKTTICKTCGHVENCLIIEELHNRIEELEDSAEIVSEEFEGDCWVAMKKLLKLTGFDFGHNDFDGITANDAFVHISDEINNMRAETLFWRDRAERRDANERGTS